MRPSGWLLIFYSVPSKPVNNRMKIWRKLAKAGAVQVRAAVYILPHSEEHYEFFQWIVSEVTSMGGEGAFVRVDRVETMTDEEIIQLFNRQREEDYRLVEKRIDELERKLSSIRKGTKRQADRSLDEEVRKLRKEYDDLKKTDFFSSNAGRVLENRIRAAESEARSISGGGERNAGTTGVTVFPRRREDYAGRTWVTRKRPFVDRMASAWLIRRFIDEKAVFKFIDERKKQFHPEKEKDMVAFDVRDGEFTHQGDMCTFEVLLKAFGLKGKPLRAIAEIVHELDMKDDKFAHPEARGIEDILSGIRKTARRDEEMLEKGVEVFEMLYASKS